MEIRPIIYDAALSSQNVTTKTKVTVTVVADDIETFYAETKYARSVFIWQKNLQQECLS